MYYHYIQLTQFIGTLLFPPIQRPEGSTLSAYRDDAETIVHSIYANPEVSVILICVVT